MGTQALILESSIGRQWELWILRAPLTWKAQFKGVDDRCGT